MSRSNQTPGTLRHVAVVDQYVVSGRIAPVLLDLTEQMIYPLREDPEAVYFIRAYAINQDRSACVHHRLCLSEGEARVIWMEATGGEELPADVFEEARR